MTLNEYLKQSERTMSPHMILSQNIKIETIHGIIGISGEAGELIDALKKAMFYGQELDIPNIKEEIGDILWYISAILRSEGWSFEEVMDENIEKLKKRYPKKFTTELSIERKDKK